MDLTPTGEAQAVALRPLLPGPFELVLASPMRRAQQTANLAGLGAFTVEEGLREWDYGSLEGKTSAEIREEYPGWSIWDGPWPDGETAVEVGHRADAVISGLLGGGWGAFGSVVIVAHGHILRVLAARWLGVAVADGRYLALDTATVGVLGWEHDYRVIRCWNQAPPPAG